MCVTAEKVKNSFLGIDKRCETLLQVFKQHNEEFEEMKNAGLRSRSTLYKYQNVYKPVGEINFPQKMIVKSCTSIK